MGHREILALTYPGERCHLPLSRDITKPIAPLNSYPTFIIGCVMQARIPMPRCASPGQRKHSHDDEKSRPCRLDNDAGCDLRTCICGRGRIVHSGLARCERPLGPATATRLQRLLSGDADRRDQCAPLSWRTEVERLTSLPCRQTDIPR